MSKNVAENRQSDWAWEEQDCPLSLCDLVSAFNPDMCGDRAALALHPLPRSSGHVLLVLSGHSPALLSMLLSSLPGGGP